jgi:modification methylase
MAGAPGPDNQDGCLPLSVWATAQHDARAQRQRRYLPASMAHRGKMLPAIAATAITRYTVPGDLVADPMCGIGTTLVEAAYLGRHGLGVEYEERWPRLAAANIDLRPPPRRRRQRRGDPRDARQLRGLLPSGTAGTAALIVTSPPYGPSIQGQVKAEVRTGGGKVVKWDNSYGTDPANLASRRLDDLLEGPAAARYSPVPLVIVPEGPRSGVSGTENSAMPREVTWLAGSSASLMRAVTGRLPAR